MKGREGRSPLLSWQVEGEREELETNSSERVVHGGDDHRVSNPDESGGHESCSPRRKKEEKSESGREGKEGRRGGEGGRERSSSLIELVLDSTTSHRATTRSGRLMRSYYSTSKLQISIRSGLRSSRTVRNHPKGGGTTHPDWRARKPSRRVSTYPSHQR